jgi:tyrosyl-tRNA synthetase
MSIKDFLRTVKDRGFIHQCTDEEGLAALPTATAYIGFDLTANSLHIGSLLQIMLLKHWQDAGNKVIVLLGGATTKIGDPSGKDTARQMLDDATIAHNFKGIRRVFDKYLDAAQTVFVNNDDWLAGYGYLDFLRMYGQQFSVNRMLTQDSVRLRLEREQNLSFLEFNYMLLQSVDFLELYKRYGCNVQMGGSDQWGNIIMGVDLVRRNIGGHVYGITTPLLTKADGGKMGKTADGAVWLDAEKTTPYDFWQFWRNTLDADVGRFLKLYTLLDMAEIERLSRASGAEINAAKEVLADAVTSLAFGEQAAQEAKATAHATFSGGGVGDNLPLFEVSQDISVIDALIGLGFASSKGEARRLIGGGGVRLDNQPVTDESFLMTVANSKAVKISAGKKRHGVIQFRC